jgi:Protein of unknown function (DUF1360)
VTFAVPSWLAFVLLALAAFRTYRLLGRDTILDRPRAWLVGLPHGWQEGDDIPDGYREGLAMFLTCAWCAGFWITLAWWLAWVASPHWTTVVAVPWALAAVVALVEKNAD